MPRAMSAILRLDTLDAATRRLPSVMQPRFVDTNSFDHTGYRHESARIHVLRLTGELH